MKFFIDTANINEITEALKTGLVDGVTTNPSLVAKEKKPFQDLIKEICSIVDGPISVEAVSQKAEDMVPEARQLASISPCVVVKIPMTIEGIKATKILTQEGIKTNVTLVFSPLQALLAAKVGATYVSPFVGRLDDIAASGMELVSQILTIYENYGFNTEVIVASVRNPIHVLEAASMGAHIATIPFNVISQLANHPLTDKGLQKFLEDWKKVTQS
ncbi:MAG: fructose-6-phosphate aldolase [Deltaproteobacteria bacterium]|nr:fructose-6-phosphate aldolase [Deltaproteobacteria bacterium]